MSIESYWEDMARYTAKRIELLDARPLNETPGQRMLNDWRDELTALAVLFNKETANGK